MTTDPTPDAATGGVLTEADREALASELEASLPNGGDPTEVAGLVLASDWLAAHTATAVEQARAEDAARLAATFSGGEYEENAADAAGEGEWSWFRWLALTARGGEGQ